MPIMIKTKHLPPQKTLLVGALMVMAAANVISMWASVHSLQVANSLTSSQVLAEQTVNANATIKDKVSAILDVPAEEPTIATIANLQEVQKENPTFYADAKAGDTVLIYSTKAVIYRGSANKIINIAPVTKAAK